MEPTIEQEKLKNLLNFGILNIDKPTNYTSFATAEIAGKILKDLGVTKFGHLGTLDPKVTGVLPICLNRACKLVNWLMKKDKTYVGIMKIHKEISKEKLEEEMSKFLGNISQLPPVRSRVKRQVRQREVYYWKILEFNQEKNLVLFEAKVEAGTYIRKLCSNLGEKIGGAHMLELRRTQAGLFSEKDTNFITLYQLEKLVKSKEYEKLVKFIILAEDIIKQIMLVLEVKEDSVKRLLNGSPIFTTDLDKNQENITSSLEDSENFAVFSKNKLIEIAKFQKKEQILAKGGVVVGWPEFVNN